MSFRFRLEKVLKHRKTIEEIAKKEFLNAQSELRAAESVLQNYYQQIEKAQQDRHILVVQGDSPGEQLCQISNYIKGSEIKIERQKDVVRSNLAIVEEKKLALQEAATEYKMIEKLRDRQQEEYRMKEKKLEEKIQIEISNTRAEMRRKNGA